MFWLKLLFVIATVTLLMYVFSKLLGRILNVYKPFFKNSYVNVKHKKVDWIIRMTCLAFILVGIVISYPKEFDEMVWYMNPYILAFILLLVPEAFRAFMEWKYASNRKDYVFTIIQLVFLTLLLILILSTNFFHLF